MLPMKRFHHGLLVDSHDGAIRHCSCRRHANKLPGKTTFSEKVSFTQYADRRFLASLRDHRESNFALLQIEHRIGGIPLCKDSLFRWKKRRVPALADGRKKSIGVELAGLLGHSFGSHGHPPGKSPVTFRESPVTIS